jgi:hypothetical protein
MAVVESPRCHVYFVWPPTWIRGSAQLDGGWIALDAVRRTRYQPTPGDTPLFELAGIRRPHDALGFVKRFGLLWHGPDAAPPRRERFSDWEHEASKLTGILRMYESTRLAVEGDDDRRTELAANDDVRRIREQSPSTTVLEAASDAVAAQIARGLSNVRMNISPAIRWLDGHGNRQGEPGEFIVSGAPNNLVEWAYHDLVLHVAEQVPVATCDDCARLFVLNHRNRRFCSDRCANRARQRRYAERRTSG